MTVISKTKAPPLAYRKYIAKLLWAQIPGELTEEGNTADEALEGFLHCLKETLIPITVISRPSMSCLPQT